MNAKLGNTNIIYDILAGFFEDQQKLIKLQAEADIYMNERRSGFQSGKKEDDTNVPMD